MMRGRQTAHVRHFVLFLSDSALFAHIHVQSKNQLIQKHMCNKSVVIDFFLRLTTKKCLEKKFNASFGKLRTVHTQLQKLNGEKRLCCISDSHCCNNCEYIYIHAYIGVCACCVLYTYRIYMQHMYVFHWCPRAAAALSCLLPAARHMHSLCE